MYYGHVSDGLVCRQLTIQGCSVIGNVSRCAKDRMLDAGALQHRNHALAVSPIGQDEDFAGWRHSGGEYGLDTEGATALQQNGFKTSFSRKPGQPEDSV